MNLTALLLLLLVWVPLTSLLVWMDLALRKPRRISAERAPCPVCNEDRDLCDHR